MKNQVESDDSSLDLLWVWTIVRRRAWIIGLCLAFAIFTAYFVTSNLPVKYEATSKLMVQPAQDVRTSDYESILVGSRLAIAYADMALSEPTLKELIYRLNLSESPIELAEKITVEAVKDTQFIRLTVTDSSPQRAAQIANLVGELLSVNVQKLQTDRYSSSLKNMEDKIKTYSTAVAETQNQLDTLNNKLSEMDAEINQLNSQNNNYRLDYQSLQQSRNTLLLTIAQQTNQVKVIEPPHASTDPTLRKPTATFVIMFDQAMLSGSTSVVDPYFEIRLKATYGPIITGQLVLNGVIKELNLDDTPENLAGNIKIDTMAGVPMLRISVMAEDTNLAVQVADAIAQGFISQLQAQLASPYNTRLAEMQKQLDDLSAKMDQNQAEIKRLSVEKTNAETELARLNTYLTITNIDLRTVQQNYDQLRQTEVETADQLVVAVPAQAPSQPVNRLLINMALGALIGLLLGFGLIFLIEKLDDRIRTGKDVTNSLGLRIISSISPLPKHKKTVLVDSLPLSGFANDFHMLGVKIRLARENEELKTLLITSPSSSEGKTITTANLAIALARSGLKVIVIDADLRLPRLHQVFNLPQEQGLAECLQGGNLMNGFLRTSNTSGLKVLTSGIIPDQPTELLNSPAMGRLLNKLSTEADIILIDCPPILAVADTTVLATLVDSVLLVLRSGVSESRMARDAYQELLNSRAKILGTVLVGVANRDGKYIKYYQSSTRKVN